MNIFVLNLGKPRNGADSFDTLEYLNALARTEQDLPALVFYSLIGKLKIYYSLLDGFTNIYWKR